MLAFIIIVIVKRYFVLVQTNARLHSSTPVLIMTLLHYNSDVLAISVASRFTLRIRFIKDFLKFEKRSMLASLKDKTLIILDERLQAWDGIERCTIPRCKEVKQRFIKENKTL